MTADTVTPTQFTEALRPVPLAEAAVGATVGHKFRALLMQSGWSLNSRFYGADMLREYGSKAFRKGALMSGDHPTGYESESRPEGTIHNVLSVLAEDAYYDATAGGLVAEVEVMPQHTDLLNERFARAIGLSIRATGMGEWGEAEGREGLIVTSLDEGGTVDWVTYAGAGGKVLALVESAPVLHEAHGLSANDLRVALQAAVDKALDDECRWCWVVDFTDDHVIYDVPSGPDEGRWQQPYTVDDAGTASLTGERVRVNTQTAYVPAATDVAASETNPHPKEAPVAENDNGAPPSGAGPVPTPPANNTAPIVSAEAANAKVAELERLLNEARSVAATRADDRQTRLEAEQALNESRSEIARLRAIEVARTAAVSALNESGLPDCVHSRVVAGVVGHEGRAIPMNESNGVDNDRLNKSVAAAITDWKLLVAQIQEASGLTGTVRGMGASARDGDTVTEADLNESLAAAFGPRPTVTKGA